MEDDLDADVAVLHFFNVMRAKGMPTTETTKPLGINCKDGRRWCDRFMRREGLSLSHRTSICQKIPALYKEKLLNFKQYVI